MNIDEQQCTICNGSGRVRNPIPGNCESLYITCEACGGSGKIAGESK